MPLDPPRLSPAPHVLSRSIAEGIVIVDTSTFAYIELDEVAADMWRALTEEEHLPAALHRLETEYDVARDRLEGDVLSLVDKLTALGLLVSGDPLPDDADVDVAVASKASRIPTAKDLYLDLLTSTLCGIPQEQVQHLGRRFLGIDVPEGMPGVYTMIGMPRLRNIRALVERALEEDIPGDLMECGVWRGGATILMRGILAAHEVTDRDVWVADSFEGLPEARTGVDVQDWGRRAGQLVATQEDVRGNFRLFGLMDAQVRFLPGWFEQTLPDSPIERLAVLRIDADLYESTMVVLENLYAAVSAGGFVIVDDYYWPSCRQAVDEFLAAHDPQAQIQAIDWTGIWWRKSG